MVMEKNEVWTPPQHWTKYDIFHTSPSQSNQTNGLWAGKYLCCTGEERKLFKVKPPMIGGNAAQGGINAAIIDKLSDDVAAKEGEFLFKSEKSKFSADQIIHYEKILEGMPQLVRNGIAAMREIFPNKKQKIKSETVAWANFDKVELPMTGFIDFESKDIVVELKTKQRSKPIERKTGWSSAKGYLPKNPLPTHISQTSFYKKATNKKVFIVYVNDVVPSEKDPGYVIFDEKHDSLSKDAIDWALEEYRRKNIIRQNIVSSSNSLTEILSKIDPEFSDPFWDFGDEYVARCKQLWGQI
tara:strand:+ start:3674 stop:4567 length:894 start_codon:yes stop_codon:yes gene_type:complete